MNLTNHSAAPARVADNLSFNYYMDLSEVLEAAIVLMIYPFL